MGDNDFARQFDGGGPRQTWNLRLSAIYGYSPSTQWFSGDSPRPADSPFYRTDLHLMTLVANADHRSGAGLGLTMPYGAIFRRDRDPNGPLDSKLETYDVGPGDLEMRLRQDLTALSGTLPRGLPRLVVSAGVVAPTGPYIPKQTSIGGDQVAIDAPTRYASLGRGVWWLLADIELFGALPADLAWYAALYTRTPLQEAINGFDWGPERRTGVGLSWRFWPKYLSASLGIDWQWRGLATELVYSPLKEQVVRTDFISGGGHWVELAPTLRAELPAGLAATATLRLPLYRDVRGTQGVQDYGVFVGVQYSLGVGDTQMPEASTAPQPLAPGSEAPGPAVAALLVPGKYTVIDYWATWCAPCLKLAPAIEQLQADRPDLAVQRLDVGDWGPAEMARYLPGLPGIPVLDLWSPEGKLVQRLVGADCMEFHKNLAIPPRPAAPPAADPPPPI